MLAHVRIPTLLPFERPRWELDAEELVGRVAENVLGAPAGGPGRRVREGARRAHRGEWGVCIEIGGGKVCERETWGVVGRRGGVGRGGEG